MIPNNNPLMLIQNMMRMGKNPQAIAQILIQQNPQMQQLVMQIQNSGMTPNQYLDQYAKQNHLEQQANQIKNMLGIK